MAVTGQTFSMFQGNRKVLRFSLTNEDTPGVLDMTNIPTFKFAMARIDASGNPLKSNPVVDLSTGAQVVRVTPVATSGVVTVELLYANTATLNPGDYYFELEATDSSGFTEVVATGTGTINVNVNNA